MTRCFLSLLMSLTLVFSTLLQFHHHDRMGNIFITLSFVGEVELGFHHHHHSDCCHHHHRGTSPGDCGDSDDCSMHLADTVITADNNENTNIIISVFDSLADIIADSEPILPIVSHHGYKRQFACKLAKLKFIKLDKHRGPPSTAY